MSRREPSRRKRGKSIVKKEEKYRAQAIGDTLVELDRLEATSPSIKGIVQLFRGWLTDESGYDEETWPKLKSALNRGRERVGARRLFDVEARYGRE